MSVSTTVLLSSAGRRIGLWNCFRESLNGKGRVAIIDSSRTAPAAHIAEQARLVPHCKSPQFLPEVLQLCRADAVSVIVPTIDTELPVYAAALEQFKSAGTTVCISSTETVLLGADKTVTHNWLSQSGFPTVRQALPSEVLREKASWPLPLIAKPYNGSASVGVRLVTSWTELELLRSESLDYIVQEKASGREFTINVYVNRQGQCVCAVPHWRMEVRAGEVSKGITVKDPRLVSLARRIAEALPGAYGPLNIQCFMEDSGEPKVIEINPRFGGGYPLAHRAGARFTSWILEELEGHKLSYFDGWQDGLAMLRYDEAVYLPAVALGVNNS
jgi:carbamoyl-phosphate synthase large subunit